MRLLLLWHWVQRPVLLVEGLAQILFHLHNAEVSRRQFMAAGALAMRDKDWWPPTMNTCSESSSGGSSQLAEYFTLVQYICCLAQRCLHVVCTGSWIGYGGSGCSPISAIFVKSSTSKTTALNVNCGTGGYREAPAKLRPSGSLARAECPAQKCGRARGESGARAAKPSPGSRSGLCARIRYLHPPNPLSVEVQYL